MRASNHLLVLAVAGCCWASVERAWAGQDEGRAEADADAIVVARVNGDPVTQAELRRMLGNPLGRQQLRQELGADAADSAALERRALTKLIQRRLILQEARRRGFTVTEQELDKAIVSLRARFGDLGSMGVWMKEQGVDDQSLFDALRNDLLVDRVRGALAEGARVTEEQVRQYYDLHELELKTEEVWIQVIAVEKRATAERVLEALRKGEDFGVLARRLSLGTRAKEGGDLGWVDFEALGPPLKEAVRALKVGEARGPLPGGSALLVVRLEARRSEPKSLAAARPDIERRLRPAAQRQAIQEWLAKEEAKAKIEIPPSDRVAEAKPR